MTMKKFHLLLISLFLLSTIAISQNLGNLPGNQSATGNNPINQSVNIQQSINYNPQIQVNNLNNIDVNNNDQQYLAVNQMKIGGNKEVNKVQISLPQISNNSSNRRTSTSTFIAGEKKHSMHLNLKVKASPQMKRFFNEKFIFSKDKKKKRRIHSKKKFYKCPKF